MKQSKQNLPTASPKHKKRCLKRIEAVYTLFFLYLVAVAFFGNCMFHVVSYIIVDPDKRPIRLLFENADRNRLFIKLHCRLTFQKASSTSRTRP